MNRRDVLKGLTAASAGSMALAFGSGAFTRVEANREFDVGLAADDTSSQLVIEENENLPSAAINPTDDSSFEFSVADIPPNSISAFGTFDTITDPESLNVPAFVIRNENDTGESVDVTLRIDTATERNTVVSLAAGPSSESTTQSTAVTATRATTGDITIEGVPSVESSDTSISDAEVDCGLLIDTTPDGVDTSSDLDLSFNVLAERSETT